jgi:hypothetical protein
LVTLPFGANIGIHAPARGLVSSVNRAGPGFLNR